MTHHPILDAAARGDLPDWARAGRERRRHMERVADLLDEWSAAERLPDEERWRRRAAGFLHDALRDADAEELQQAAMGDLPEWPEPIRHGPAVASRLRHEGVTDEGFLHALAYHTIGHPEFDALGRALYSADFLEPGRQGLAEVRDELRRRMPAHERAVLPEVARLRLGHALERRRHLMPETVAFWKGLIEMTDERMDTNGG